MNFWIFKYKIKMTPKILAYLSIIIWTIVLSVTILMIIFPKLFLKIDERLQLKKPRTPWKERFALRINHAISPLTVSIFYAIIGVILALAGQRHILGIVFCSMISASIGFRAVKRITQRPRPQDALLKFKDYSFPSGHTTAGFVFFLSLAMAWSWVLENHFAWILYTLALIWWIIVWWSRWYIKVHWVTDIIIWALLGCGCFIFSYLLFVYFGDAVIQAIEKVFFTL